MAAVLALTLLALSQPAPFQNAPFEDEIRKYEAADRANPPAKGGIVFVGSSSIRMWSTLQQDFPGYPVINRGFGGSQLADSVRYVHRIVTPYEPRMIVMFAGTNDIASGKTPETVLADFRAFVSEVRTKLPKTRIVYIAITPAPSRWAKLGEVKKTNRLIRDYIKRDRSLRYVDTFSKMLTGEGGPRPELFVSDQLHLNAAGYAIWKQELTPFIARFER